MNSDLLREQYVLLPTATECLVGRHLIRELRLVDRDQSLLGGVKPTLGVECREVAVYAKTKAHFR